MCITNTMIYHTKK